MIYQLLSLAFLVFAGQLESDFLFFSFHPCKVRRIELLSTTTRFTFHCKAGYDVEQAIIFHKVDVLPNTYRMTGFHSSRSIIALDEIVEPTTIISSFRGNCPHQDEPLEYAFSKMTPMVRHAQRRWEWSVNG